MKEETRQTLKCKNLRVGLCGRGLKAIKNLNGFLQLDEPDYRWVVRPGDYDLYVGWGRKPSGLKAVRLATKYRKPFLLLEDAFVRSYAPQSVSGEHALGLVIDDEGMYYDASCPSRLERLIMEARDDETAQRAGQRIIDMLRNLQVCKYNNFDVSPPTTLNNKDKSGVVLVVDQTWQDCSVTGAGANNKSFKSMLEASADENPGKAIVVKLHPETMAGKKRGYLKDLAAHDHFEIMTDNINPWNLFHHVSKVYTVSSQLGFDALMAGLDVRCFGHPFYAGWGLTQDEAICQRRRGLPMTVEAITYAALYSYARHIDSSTSLPCDIEQTAAQIAILRDKHNQMK